MKVIDRSRCRVNQIVERKRSCAAVFRVYTWPLHFTFALLHRPDPCRRLHEPAHPHGRAGEGP